MNDEIRDAATQSAKQGGDIRGRVHDLTLEALKARRFDREAIRDVVRSVTEGISRGAEGSGLGVRQTLAEALPRHGPGAHRVGAGRARGAAPDGRPPGAACPRTSSSRPRPGCRRSRRTSSPRSSRWRARRTSACAPSCRELVRQAAHAGTETGRRSAP